MDAIAKLTESTAYNVFIQLSFRASTFLLNAILLRYITKDLLGVVNVSLFVATLLSFLRLMLLYTTISFFAREPFRRSCLQYERTGNWRQTINVLWLCPLFAVPVVIVLILVWSYALTTPDENSVKYYGPTVLCYGLAIFIECLAEPLWVLGQSVLFVKLKAFIEAFYIALRQFLFAILILTRPESSLLNFGASMVISQSVLDIFDSFMFSVQLISSTVYTLMYYIYFIWYLQLSKRKARGFPLKNARELFPIFKAGLDKNLVSLTVSFWRHSFVKQLLTEGERYVMTVFNTLNFADQGIYDVITNLGALVARIIFAPLEESAYVYFSLNIKRGCVVDEQNKEEFKVATKVFTALLKLVCLIGCIILAFGISYSFLALKIYGGDILSIGSGPTLLRWYCGYVFILAINGITECFSFAVMPEHQVDKHQRWLVVCCFCFLAAALILTSYYGSVGFILANCVNMICRIIYSCRFIHRFYSTDSSSVRRPSPLLAMIPNSSVIFALFVSLMVTFLSEVIFCCSGAFNTLAHIAVGCVCLFATLMSVYTSEVDFVDFVMTYILKFKSEKDS